MSQYHRDGVPVTEAPDYSGARPRLTVASAFCTGYALVAVLWHKEHHHQRRVTHRDIHRHRNKWEALWYSPRCSVHICTELRSIHIKRSPPSVVGSGKQVKLCAHKKKPGRHEPRSHLQDHQETPIERTNKRTSEQTNERVIWSQRSPWERTLSQETQRRLPTPRCWPVCQQQCHGVLPTWHKWAVTVFFTPHQEKDRSPHSPF